jgi:hypothetical protein
VPRDGPLVSWPPFKTFAVDYCLVSVCRILTGKRTVHSRQIAVAICGFSKLVSKGVTYRSMSVRRTAMVPLMMPSSPINIATGPICEVCIVARQGKGRIRQMQLATSRNEFGSPAPFGSNNSSSGTDFFMTMAAATGYQWAAIGTGHKMDHSFIIDTQPKTRMVVSIHNIKLASSIYQWNKYISLYHRAWDWQLHKSRIAPME